MKKIFSFFWYNLFFLLLLLSMTSVDVLAVETKSDKVFQDYTSEVGVKFKEHEEKRIPKDKDSIYTPEEISEVKRLLPQTGETILSFIIILIGFSVVLLISGIYILNKTMKINALIYQD